MGEMVFTSEMYLRSMRLFDGIEASPPGLAGAGEAFGKLAEDLNYTQDEIDVAQGNLMALLGHSEGLHGRGDGDLPIERYQEVARDVWSFHRAWVDRYGYVHAMPATDR